MYAVADQAQLLPAVPAKQAAATLGCDLSHAYKLLRRGLLQGYRDGRAIRIYVHSIVAYQRREPLGEPAPAPAKSQRRISRAAHAQAVAQLRALGCLG